MQTDHVKIRNLYTIAFLCNAVSMGTRVSTLITAISTNNTSEIAYSTIYLMTTLTIFGVCIYRFQQLQKEQD